MDDKQSNLWSRMLNNEQQNSVAARAWQKDAGESYMADLANKESERIKETVADTRQTSLKI